MNVCCFQMYAFRSLQSFIVTRRARMTVHEPLNNSFYALNVLRVSKLRLHAEIRGETLHSRPSPSAEGARRSIPEKHVVLTTRGLRERGHETLLNVD